MSTDPAKLSRREFIKLLSLLPLLGASSKVDFFGRTFASHPSPNQPGADNTRPNFIIMLFDTLSARNLSLYGYSRQTTPNLARFAQRATVFHQHYAAGNFTLPGTASLLTSVYPWTHRGLHVMGTVREEFAHKNLFSELADEYFIQTYTHNMLVMSLFQQFQKSLDELVLPHELAILNEPLTDYLFPEDYYASFWGERVYRGSGTDLPGSLFLSFRPLFAEDFHPFTPQSLTEKYGELFPRGIPNNSLGLFFKLEDAIDWIQTQASGLPQPFLGYFHLLPPHEPYKTRHDFVDRFDDGWQPTVKPASVFSLGVSQEDLNLRRRWYDEYIAYVDAEFGRLINNLERNGALENTYLILTSDHGQLFERGIHGHVTSTLYHPLLHIPLLISKPGQQERVDVTTPTSCIDVLPTVLHLAGKASPEWAQGRILPTFGGEETASQRSLFALEAKNNPKMAPLRIGSMAMIRNGHKIVRYFGWGARRDGYELYDLQNDPQELHDLYETRKSLAQEMKAELDAKLQQENRNFKEG
jgi:arylsulfatase A-like enzyme